MTFSAIRSEIDNSRIGGDSNKRLLQCETKWMDYKDCEYLNGLNEELQQICSFFNKHISNHCSTV